MSRFLQGEASDSFAWVEHDKELVKQIKESGIDLVGLAASNSHGNLNNAFPLTMANTRIIRRSNIFHRIFNTAYYSVLIGGSIYTVAHYLEYREIWFLKGYQQQISSFLDQISRRFNELLLPLHQSPKSSK